MRDGISAFLAEHDDLRVVGALGAADNILQKIGALKPNVLLLDMGLRSQNSLNLVKTIKADAPATNVVVMDLIPTQEDVLEFVRAGVSGFILKDATIEDFLRTIRTVADGAQVLPPVLTGSLFSQIIANAVSQASGSPSVVLKAVRMTRRERQVIASVAEGMTNKEIADKLNLSTYTVKSHVHNILEKLALHTRVQIARYAHATGEQAGNPNSVSLLDD